MNYFRPLLTPIGTVLAVFIFLYIFSFLFGPLPLSVNSTNTTTSDVFTVSATGEADATAQNANFTVGVTETADTAEAAQAQVNAKINEIVSQMKAAGVEEQSIKTESLNVNPQYDFVSGTREPNGFSASQNINVKAPIDIANTALDQAVANGANVVYGITFELDDADQDALEAQAREDAINKAKAKAQTIADAAGLKLGRIINVQEYREDGGFMPLMARDEVASSEIMQNTNLQPGENTVRLNVTLSYETL